MKCDRVREQAAEYLSGRLDSAAREQVAAHIDGCAACRAEYEELREVWDGLEKLPEPEPGPEMRGRFLGMLEAYQTGLAAGRAERTAPAPKRVWNWGWLGARPAWQVAFSAALLIAGALGGRYLARPGSGGQAPSEVAQLRNQVESLRQLVTLSMLQQQSPAARLRGVNYTYQMAQPDQQVEQALLHAVTHDSNVNVRLSAVDALQKFAGEPEVRRALVDAIPVQDSPLVQVALIDLLAQLNDTEAAPALRKLAGDPQVNEAVRQRAAWALGKLEVAK